MLQKTNANKLVWSALVMLTAMPLAMGQASPARTAALAHHVADAMERAGFGVNLNQIEFLSGESNIGESANVRVVSVNHGAAGAVKVKLRCRNNHECLPFYVLVHGLDRVNLDSSKVGTLPTVVAASPQNVIRGGDHATLILESPDSRMSLPVICLQSGVRGQTIRVTSPDRKRVFDAEIVSTGMLKGTL